MPQRTSAERKARQQRKRDAERAKQAAAREAWQRAEDIRLEALAEDRAPAAQRRSTELRAPTAIPDRKTGGYRRANPLWRMHQADHGRTITRLHLAAATRFSEDYEIGIEGARLTMAARGIQDGCETADVSQTRMAALARYRAACEALGGTLRTPVQLLVLHNTPISRMVGLFGLVEDRLSGWVLAGLDRLCDHYWPNRVTRSDAADVLMLDPTITDIPQERLGRALIGA